METKVNQKKASSLSDWESYSETPYKDLSGMEVRRKSSSKKAMNAINMDTGEVLGLFIEARDVKDLGAEFLIDREVYCKFFQKNYKIFSSLSSPGIKVLFYIAENLKPNSEEIQLVSTELVDVLGYSNSKNVRDGIAELLSYNIIARKVGRSSTYFVNPNCLFNGDRTTLLQKPFREDVYEELRKDNSKRVKELSIR